MALTPKLSYCLKDNCSKLEVKDVTGIYSSPSNVGGWGIPNTTLASVNEALLKITLPNGTIEEIDITPIINAATIVNGVFSIGVYTPNNLGVSLFDDGIYFYEYVIEDDNGIYRFYSRNFSYCKVQCCIDKMYKRALDDHCNCDLDEKLLEAAFAESLLFAAKSAYGCGNFDKAKSMLKRLQKICEFKKCKC